MSILLMPPIAFVIYVVAVGALTQLGKRLAGSNPPQASPLKTNLYASGNAPSEQAAPGYRAFFSIALFFAILHLSALVIGSSDLSPIAAIYLIGLALTLLALLLG